MMLIIAAATYHYSKICSISMLFQYTFILREKFKIVLIGSLSGNTATNQFKHNMVFIVLSTLTFDVTLVVF